MLWQEYERSSSIEMYSMRLGSSNRIVNRRGPFSCWSNSHRTFQSRGGIICANGYSPQWFFERPEARVSGACHGWLLVFANRVASVTVKAY